MYNKKSQVTVFIILGILLVLVVLILMYVKNISIETVTEPSIKKTFDITTLPTQVKTYVESCIKSVSEPIIKTLTKNGGTLNPDSGIYYNGEEVNVFCTETKDKGCINSLLLRQDMEKELSSNIKNELLNCINLNTFKKQELDIEEGNLDVKTHIGVSDILIKVNYSLILSREDFKQQISEFSSNVHYPLGLLYTLALDIINKEISKGYFDKDDWMEKHGYDVIIEKHKPYPNTIYILTKHNEETKKDYVFKFAIKGVETVGEDIIKKPLYAYGCCYNNDNLCFKNTPPDKCDVYYDDNIDCICDEMIKPSKKGCCAVDFYCEISTQQECTETWSGHDFTFYEDDFLCSKANCENLECAKTYNYADKDYTWIPKKHGESWCVYDSAVGNGFDYVGTRHYLHTCILGKEYVEECRDYREELCTQNNRTINSKVFTKANCRLNRWYDCTAQQNINDCNNKRFRDCFWFDTLKLEKHNKCLPYVPPGFKFWGNKAEKICSFGSEPKGDVRKELPMAWGYSTLFYCQRLGDCGNFRNIADRITKFGYFNPDGNPDPVKYPIVYLNDGYIKKGLNFLITLGLYDINLSQNVRIPSDFYGNYAKCRQWQAPPDGNDCHLCNESKFKPCTEYKCKSLGQNCIFTINNGIPNCFAQGQGDLSGPEINFDESILSQGFTFSKTYNTDFDATEYKISPEILPRFPFMFGIKTSELTRCEISLRPPTIQYSDSMFGLPNAWFSGTEFKEKHNATLRFPPITVINMSNYLLFIRCIDTSGNPNEKEIFLNVNIANLTNDTSVPIILGTNPNKLTKDGSEIEFNLYINKPFHDCGYSNLDANFNNMVSLNCSTTESDITYEPFIPIGSFICNTKLKLDSDTYYFNCEDYNNKTNQKNYELRVS